MITQILGPLIPQLTSTPIITSHDLPPLIAHNPTLAHPIIVSLLSQPSIATYLDVLRRLPPLGPFPHLGRAQIVGCVDVADLEVTFLLVSQVARLCGRTGGGECRRIPP